MIKSLTKHGNSMALVIDKPILELIGATPDTQFKVTTNGDALVLSPVREKPHPRLDEILEDLHQRYGKAFKKLAE